MSNVTSVLATRARQYLDDNLSSERDIRLIFPGLTRSLAVELHRVIGAALGDGDVPHIPVYLALDDTDQETKPDEEKSYLLYEAVTSVRSGSFVAVCMPKVLPKLHDSISGTGSPIRGLVFSDEWPWVDDQMEHFRFGGAFLAQLIKEWRTEESESEWLRELIAGPLLDGTRSLPDATRIPLLLEEILGSFAPKTSPELADVLDAFLFHAGMPCCPSGTERPSVRNYAERVSQVAKILFELRSKNPDFRTFLVEEAVPRHYPSGDERDAIQSALQVFLDGALTLGVQAGALALRHGLGRDADGGSVVVPLAAGRAGATVGGGCARRVVLRVSAP